MKDAGKCRDKKEKATQERIRVQLEEINQKILTKEERLKRYIYTKGKTIEIKQDILKQLKKILPTRGRRWHENIQTTGCKRTRTILD